MIRQHLYSDTHFLLSCHSQFLVKRFWPRSALPAAVRIYSTHDRHNRHARRCTPLAWNHPHFQLWQHIGLLGCFPQRNTSTLICWISATAASLQFMMWYILIGKAWEYSSRKRQISKHLERNKFIWNVITILKSVIAATRIHHSVHTYIYTINTRLQLAIPFPTESRFVRVHCGSLWSEEGTYNERLVSLIGNDFMEGLSFISPKKIVLKMFQRLPLNESHVSWKSPFLFP